MPVCTSCLLCYYSSISPFRIMDSPKIRITDKQKENIRDLLCLFNECTKVCSAKATKVCNQTGEDFYTVDNILLAATHLPLGDRRKLERLRISVVGQASGKIPQFLPLISDTMYKKRKDREELKKKIVIECGVVVEKNHQWCREMPDWPIIIFIICGKPGKPSLLHVFVCVLEICRNLTRG